MPGAKFRIAVLGDLHFEPKDERTFKSMRAQTLKTKPKLLVNLGDLGGYSHAGSLRSFEEGYEFFSGFSIPFFTLLGNHDLENPEFKTDAENIAAWMRVFGYSRPYQAVEAGGAVCLLLSSTCFRESDRFQHEIYIDEAQFEWLAGALEQYRERPVAIFSHAPILGSGLRVIQSLHLKFGNAWLNHTHGPERFIELVRRHPNVKLWFSAHNHLSQDYPDSIAFDGECAYVHTGVMGRVSRDGRFQSRILDIDTTGFELHTLDHTTGRLRSDLKSGFTDGAFERLAPPTPPYTPEFNAPPEFPEGELSLRIGPSAFAVGGDSLVEYDLRLKAPLGVVVERLDGRRPLVEEGKLYLVSPAGDKEEIRPLMGERFMRWARR